MDVWKWIRSPCEFSFLLIILIRKNIEYWIWYLVQMTDYTAVDSINVLLIDWHFTLVIFLFGSFHWYQSNFSLISILWSFFNTDSSTCTESTSRCQSHSSHHKTSMQISRLHWESLIPFVSVCVPREQWLHRGRGSAWLLPISACWAAPRILVGTRRCFHCKEPPGPTTVSSITGHPDLL